ncbi:MAG: response regulator [Polyangiaceae bacterium]
MTPSPLGILRVLVVEDDDDSREMLSELISSLGYAALSAANADEALAIARGEWDVALIDLGLPGRDGCELARLLRAADGGAMGRLVALTGYSDAASRSAASEAGFEEFLVKPVFPEKLAELLAQLAS